MSWATTNGLRGLSGLSRYGHTILERIPQRMMATDTTTVAQEALKTPGGNGGGAGGLSGWWKRQGETARTVLSIGASVVSFGYLIQRQLRESELRMEAKMEQKINNTEIRLDARISNVAKEISKIRADIKVLLWQNQLQGKGVATDSEKKNIQSL